MIAHVDLGSFFIAVERARKPELIGRAIVIGGRPGSGGLVAAASREARRAGVRPGMLLAQASVRCPDAVFLGGAVDAYLAASARVDEVLRRESVDIEWVSIDEAYIGIPHTLRPGSSGKGTPANASADIAAIERIQKALQAMGLDAACGLARTKVVARIASQLARPRGVVHVLEGYEARFLAPLKIELLPGVDPVLGRKLRAAGIRRLGQLAKLSETQLSLLAGRSGATLARQAAGIDLTRVLRTALPHAPLDDYELPTPTADPEVLRALVGARAEHLGRQLRAHGVVARSITLRIRYADGRVDSRTAALAQPSALDEPLSAVACELLIKMSRPERLVRAVNVTCPGLLSAAGDPALFAV
jgi:DNA polymerase-4